MADDLPPLETPAVYHDWPVPDATKCNCANKHGGTTPVGQFSPAGDSPYGVADMAGSVWEWTRSLYQPYPYDQNVEEREDPSDACGAALRPRGT